MHEDLWTHYGQSCRTTIKHKFFDEGSSYVKFEA